MGFCTFRIPQEDKIRYKRMFDTLDTNSDGLIEFCELCVAINKIYAETNGVNLRVEEIYKKAGKNPDYLLNFREFVILMNHLEKDLKIMFMAFDVKKDGKIGVEEVQSFFKKYNVQLSQKEAENLIEKIVKDGDTEITWEQWRTFHQYHFFIDINDMVKGSFVKDVHFKDALMELIREGGVRALWRSNLTSILKMMPDSAIRFSAYEQIKNFLKEDSQKPLTIGQKFLAGSTAGMMSQSIVYPLEVLKVKMAISKTNEYCSLINCVQKSYRADGLKSFYRGFLTSLVGIVPYSGLDLVTYETLKLAYEKRYSDARHPGVLVVLCCGMFSSICSQTLTYPISLLKAELQAGVHGGSTKTAFKTAKRIFRTEGIKGFYKGLVPCLMKVIPAVSLSYVVYEEAKLALSVV